MREGCFGSWYSDAAWVSICLARAGFPPLHGCDRVVAHKATNMPVGNKQIVRKLFNNLLNKGNLAVADEIIAPNHVNHDPATPDTGKGPEGAEQIVTLYRNAFPDLAFAI